MKNNKVNEMTWTQFDMYRKECHTVIIPTGAVECYGPHLPMASDTLVSEKIACLIAEETGAFIGPTLPVGDSLSLSMFPGTLSVRPESFKEYLRDIIESFTKWGIRNFLFINGHAGNVPMITQLSNEYVMAHDTMRFAQIDWWRYAQMNGDDIFENKGYMAHGHASECGTSVLMYLCPELVHADLLRNETPKVVNSKRLPSITRTTPFCEFSDIGMIGDATTASREKGEKLVTRCVERIIRYMNEDFISMEANDV